MTVETSILQPNVASATEFNRDHPQLKKIEEQTTIQDFIMKGLTPTLREQVREAVTVYPEKMRPAFEKDAAQFRIVTITPKEPTGEEKKAMILMIGMGGTAYGTSNIAAELYRKQEEKESHSIGLAAVLSSSASMDTVNDPFPENPVERAGIQAAYIFELLKQHPLKELDLVGHSLGAYELLHMAPVLKKLIDQYNENNPGGELKTKINSITLAAPGGIIQQHALEFGKKALEVGTFHAEVDEMFPTYEAIDTVAKAIDTSAEKGNWEYVKVLQNRRQEMIVKHEEPQNIPDEIKAEYTALTDAFDRAYAKLHGKTLSSSVAKSLENEMDSLQKKRYTLLVPIIRKVLSSADNRTATPLQELQTYGRVAQAAVLTKEGGLVHTLPLDVRRMITAPITIISGEEDLYFEDREMTKTMQQVEKETKEKLQENDTLKLTDEYIEKRSQFFPKSLAVHHVHVGNWPHIAVATNAEKFAQIVVENMLDQDTEITKAREEQRLPGSNITHSER